MLSNWSMPGFVRRKLMLRLARLTLLATLFDSGVALAQQPAASSPSGAIGGETLLRGEFGKAVDSLSRELEATDLNNDKRAGLLNDRGVAQWRIGALKPALDDFNAAATLYPELASIYNNRGNVLLALQVPAEAVRDFERAILLAPSYSAAYNNRAIAQIQLGNLTAAIADFSKASELAPNAPAPINGRGRVHLESGRPYLALRDFSRAIALDPSYRPGYRNRALVRIALHQYTVAIDDLSNALTFAPSDPGMLLTRGTAQIAAQNYGAALQDLDKLVGLTPNSPAAYAERGRARSMMGSFPEAMTDFAKALEFDAKYRDAYVYRAEAHQLNNDADLGLADTERALKIDRGFALSFRVRARLEEIQGQKPEAIADFQQAVQLDPDDKDAQAGLQRLTGKSKPAATEIDGSQFDTWTVVKDGDKFLARDDKRPGLFVRLELLGAETAKLTNFEEKAAPFKGIGVLRYLAGRKDGTDGPKDIELAAIIDLLHQSQIGIEPYSEGDTLANWTWADSGDLIVQGPDGVSSSYHLAQALAMAGGSGRTPSSQAGTSQQRRQSTASAAPTHRKKSFSIFDLLFN